MGEYDPKTYFYNPAHEEIARSRYFRKDSTGKALEHNIFEVFNRVNSYLFDEPELREKMQRLCEEKKFMYAGRPLAQAGTENTSLLNCFVLDIDDSREAISECQRIHFHVQAHGGGTGINFSALRPSGAWCKGVNARSSGPEGFITAMSALSSNISHGGNRCLPGSVPVYLAGGGCSPIREIQPGTRVVAFDRNSQSPMASTVVEVYENGIQDVFTYYLDNGKIIHCTSNHRWLGRNDAGEFKVATPDVLQAEGYGILHLTQSPDNRTIATPAKIIYKKYQGQTETFCLEIDHPDHLFVADGFVSHNSGANMGILEDWHPGLLKFITRKSESNWENVRKFSFIINENKFRQWQWVHPYDWQTFNVSVALSDDFMKQVKKNSKEPWILHWKGTPWGLWDFEFTLTEFLPEGDSITETFTITVTAPDEEVARHEALNEIPFRNDSTLRLVRGPYHLTAKEWFYRICRNAWEDGCPGIFFIDRARAYHNAEYFNPVKATNPCFPGDQYLLTTEGYKTFSELVTRPGLLNIIQDARVSYDGPENDEHNPKYWQINEEQRGHVTNPASPVYMTQAEADIAKVITVEGFEVRCTWDHHFAVRGKGMVAAEDLRPGDKILLAETHVYPFVDHESVDYKSGYLFGQLLCRDGDIVELPNGEVFESDVLRRLFQYYGVFEDDLTEFSSSSFEHGNFMAGVLAGIYAVNGYYVSNENRYSSYADKTLVLDNLPSKSLAQRLQREALLFGAKGCIVQGPHKNYELGFTGFHYYRIMRALFPPDFIKRPMWIEEELYPEKDFWVEVEAVINNGREPVYCLQEQERRTVVVNGLTARRCAEQVLPAWSVCCLSSVVLPEFVTEKGTVDWDGLKEAVYMGVRALNKIIDKTRTGVPQIDDNMLRERRVGLGTIGMHEMIIRVALRSGKDIRYSNEAGRRFARKVLKFIKHSAYEASIELAKEQGPFPAFDYKQFIKSKFMKKLLKERPDFIPLLKKHGIANVTLLTQAPTGCQSPDTLVTTDQGILRLDEIVSPTGPQWQNIDLRVAQDELDDVEASRGYVNGISSTIKIALRSGIVLRATPNHQYRVFDPSEGYIWKQARNLRKGDRLAVRLGGYKKTTNHVVKFSEGQALEITPDIAWLAGLFAASGKRLPDNTLSVEVLSTAVEAIENRISKFSSLGCSLTEINNIDGVSTLLIPRTYIVDLMDRAGLFNPFSVPEGVRRSSVDAIEAYVKGYSAAKGSSLPSRTDGSQDFPFALLVSSPSLVASLSVCLRALGYMTVLDNKTLRINKNLGECMAADEIHFTALDSGITLDLEVPDTQTYIANSIVSHNTSGTITGYSSGCEPYFAMCYIRNSNLGSYMDGCPSFIEWLEQNNIDFSEYNFSLAELRKKKKVPPVFEEAQEISWKDHLAMQAVFSEHVDSSVSKCLAKGTLLSTNYGLLEIENCGSARTPGKFDPALEGLTVIDGSGVERRVTSHYCAGVLPATRVVAANGAEIVGATETHKVLTLRGWKLLSELTTEDYIITQETFTDLYPAVPTRLETLRQRLAEMEGSTVPVILARAPDGEAFISRDKKEAYFVAELFRKLGVPRVVLETDGEEYKVVLQGTLAEKFFGTSDVPEETGYCLASPVNPEELDTLETWTVTTDVVLCTRTTARKHGWHVVSTLERVVEIEDAGDLEMYDIEVEDTHTYLVSGLVSHNTINLPNSATVEDVMNAYIEAFNYNIKSTTIYRDGSKVQILEKLQKSVAKNELRPSKVLTLPAPKRPKELPCDVHTVSVKGTKWKVLVGLLYKKPYEMFCFPEDRIELPSSIENGKIIKAGNGSYTLEVDWKGDKLVVKDLASLLLSDEHRMVTRLLSTSLRHGAPLEAVIKQLQKCDGDVTAFSKALVRVLKRYAKEEQLLANAVCQECAGSNLVFEDGCFKCIDCGFSGCS